MAVQLIQTDDIGDYLQKKYGSIPPNTHIGCFYIKLGQKMSEIPMIQEQVATALANIPGLTQPCFKIEPGWDGAFVFEVPEPTTNNQRIHEAQINDAIQRQLMTVLSGQSTNIHIILSRACLYKKDKKRASSHGITTDKIGDIMENVYEQDTTGSTHIEYFYLFVQAVIREERSDTQLKIKDEKVQSEALEELETLPGYWEAMKPKKTWPGTIFGFFPKGMQPMTERDREELLNGEVRIPLIERLEAKLKDKKLFDSLGLKVKAKVIITRACKYTPTK